MMSQEYDPVLSAKAWEFLSSLSKKRQQRITRLIYQLAEYPHQLGDYHTQDNTRRRLENIHLEGCLFTYWADGPVKELRILDIVEL